MKQCSLCAALLGLLCLTSLVFAQQDFSRVEVKSTRVADGIYMIEGSGGNIGVSVGEDGLFMIDDQYAPLADKIRAELTKLGKSEPDFLLNTHWHGDHTGGNESFGKVATIIAHENVRRRLDSRQRRGGPAPKNALPVITYKESLSLHLNGEEIEVFHLKAAHTDGDSVVHFTGSNVIHLGDLFFSGMLPFVDLDSGGDVIGLTKRIAQILDMVPDDIKIIPGHGPLSTKEDLRKYHRMLVETSALVRKKMDAGKSFESIKGGGLPDEWKGWAWGFINEARWIEIVYRSLRARR